VTFLPLLSEACVFDLLVYADKDATVPVEWEDSDPYFIANAEQVRLRSFNTMVSAPCGLRDDFVCIVLF
jgi:mitotic spindle assembly checkpoint protein MAD2